MDAYLKHISDKTKEIKTKAAKLQKEEEYFERMLATATKEGKLPEVMEFR